MRSQDDFGSIHEALLVDNSAAVLKLIDAGYKVDEVDVEGRTPLFYAVKAGNMLLVDRLLECGSNPDHVDVSLRTPLHFSAMFHQVEAARKLLEAGAYVDAQDLNGNSPLSNAVFESRGRSEMVTLLKQMGACSELKNKHDVSPLDLAHNIAGFDVTLLANSAAGQ